MDFYDFLFGFCFVSFRFPSFVICLFGVQGGIFMVIICVGRVLHHPSFYLYKTQ